MSQPSASRPFRHLRRWCGNRGSKASTGDNERFDEMEVRLAEMDAEIDEISENMAAVLAILRAGDNTAADGSESVVAASSESDRPN